MGESPMPWKIRKIGEDNFAVENDASELVATISESKATWFVKFSDPVMSAFDWDCTTMRDGFDRCVGYVRGIERAAEMLTRPASSRSIRGLFRRESGQ
jgi:hypothetical protein